jgi:hypothetical protein
MSKVYLTIHEVICSGLERDWVVVCDSGERAEEVIQKLPYNCTVLNRDIK